MIISTSGDSLLVLGITAVPSWENLIVVIHLTVATSPSPSLMFKFR